jgi:hypothetical protein
MAFELSFSNIPIHWVAKYCNVSKPKLFDTGVPGDDKRLNGYFDLDAMINVLSDLF